MNSELKAIRERVGLSQTALALKAGIEPSRMSYYERGRRPCQRNAKRIADALGVNVRELWPEFDTLRAW